MIVVTVARKPLAGTVANTVLEWGTGGLNIDGCRIEAGRDYTDVGSPLRFTASSMGYMGSLQTRPWAQRAIAAGLPVKNTVPSSLGRYPANVILQGEDVVDALDEQSGVSLSAFRSGGVGEHLDPTKEDWRFKRAEGGFTDSGGASRFFKQVKP